MIRFLADPVMRICRCGGLPRTLFHVPAAIAVDAANATASATIPTSRDPYSAMMRNTRLDVGSPYRQMR